MKTIFSRGRLALRIASILLVVFLLAANVCTCFAAGIETVKKVRTKDIAIVFDDSGSMYINPTPTAWCRATYAIEVFAAMLNEGDRIRIYPMTGIETGGKEYTKENPLTITSTNVSSVRDIFSPKAGDTHIEAVYEAYKGLMSSTGYNDKWLIVLTDGAEFYEEGKPLGKNTKDKLTETLGQYSQDVNVMYLGIGKQSAMPDVTGNGKYVFDVEQASDSNSVLEKLSTMSNAIFGRDALDVKADKIEFDIPMSKLIVFVQGSDIQNISLEGSNQNPTSIYNPRYGERGAGNYRVSVDTSLQGSLATFENVPAGSYTVKYNGTKSSIDVFYEPDVTLKCELFNADGERLDGAVGADTAYPGTYILNFGLAAKTADGTYEYTQSPLLGKTNYTLTVYRNGEKSDPLTSSKPGSLSIENLQEGETLDAEIKASYLKNYQVTLRGSEIGWPEDGWKILKQRDYVLDTSLFVTQTYYQVSKMDEGDPIIIKVKLNGQDLTREQMDALETKIDFDGIKTTTEPDYDNSAFNVHLHTGKYEDGKYKLTTKVTGIDFDGNPVSSTKTAEFKVNRFPSWLKWAVLGAALLLLAIIIFLILQIKMCPPISKGSPSDFYADGENGFGEVEFDVSKDSRKERTITITSPRFEGTRPGVTLNTVTLSSLKDRNDNKQLKVTNCDASMSFNTVKIGGVTLTRNESNSFAPKPNTDWPIISNGDMMTATGETGGDGRVSHTILLKSRINFVKEE